MLSLIGIKELIEEIQSGSLNVNELSSKLNSEILDIQDKYSPFITIKKTDAKEFTESEFPIPISIKDCICTKGIQTTAGSKILEGYMPPMDATSIKRLKSAGAVITGKTAQDEFGFGSFSTNCAYSIPKNPYDKNRSCGGSSGGAACVVAASKIPHVAIAESTGGSITAPAAFTGTFGITPTYGLISRNGLIDYSNSMDKIGVISKDLYGASLAITIMSGYDQLDSTSSKNPKTDLTKYVNRSIENIRIGIPEEYFQGVDEHITKAVYGYMDKLEDKGAEIKEIKLKMTNYSIAAYYIIAMCEASTNLAKYCGMRYGLQDRIEGNISEYFSRIRTEGFGIEAKRRIILGTYARSAGMKDQYYTKSMKVRGMIIKEFRSSFRNVDAIIAPSMPTIAPRFSEIEDMEPLEIYNMDRLTTAPNLAGIPTVSVPIGKLESMPIGMQIMTDHFNEGIGISLASAAVGEIV